MVPKCQANSIFPAYQETGSSNFDWDRRVNDSLCGKVTVLVTIASGSVKIYLHGSFAAYAVGVDEQFMPLIKGLPREDAGVGCVIDDLDVFEAQREYATRCNKFIVERMQSRSEKNG